ncbi:MAG TPA: putative peptidoglycan glycosyltransferase FtsW, partial [Candidatus Manganitrophaceae bacterium]|nr:putative peptidoglycan glycosyltransferase FtsW [Candidatus Manganitrophaceae bacterium]
MKVIADPVFRQEKFIFEETRRGRADFGVGDKGLLLIALLLGGLGLVMVYSASGVLAAKIYQDGAHFLKKQLIWTVLGLFLFWGSARLDVERLRRRLFPFACGIFLLLISALLFGAEINGSRRWVQAGPVRFQPSELAKLFTVVYLSSYIAKKGEGLREFFKGVAPVLVLVGAECALILMEPDLGTTATLLLISAALLFLGGCALRHLTALGLFVLPLFVYWIMKTPYRRERIMVFLNPWSDASASGFQMIQSLLALGSGGAIGTGLGEGRQKLFFLPEPHTDFIFSVIGEELGLLGTL